MSIGFTIPFVMICRNPIDSFSTIGLIMACFRERTQNLNSAAGLPLTLTSVLTGVFNTIISYFLALPLQYVMDRLGHCRRRTGLSNANDTEAQLEPKAQPPRVPIAFKSVEASRGGLYNGTELVSPGTTRSSTPAEKMLGEVEDKPAAPVRRSRLLSWGLRNPMLLVSWLLAGCVGLPLRYTTGNDKFLAACLLFATWFTTLAVQTGVKTTPHLRPWLGTLLSGVFNAVLWTSLVMIAYAFAESAITSRPLPEVLDTLHTRTTLSDLILRKANPIHRRHADISNTTTNTNDASLSMAAGDIALSILNAGLVSWGLKLYEYRRQLFSRAGLTVFSVSSLLALGNVALGPLLARALGLGSASQDLAFAARSVTLALGAPVMATLGGDTGLNAAMVVVSGIVYQMGLGFGIGAWLERQLGLMLGTQQRSTDRDRDQDAGVTFPSFVTKENRNVEKQQQQTCVPSMPIASATSAGADDTEIATSDDPSAHIDYNKTELKERQDNQDQEQQEDTPQTVAAGITVGINAAAMGTAYLYEVQSSAAPYSALSMMALGLMTVVVSSLDPLAQWVMQQAAS